MPKAKAKKIRQKENDARRLQKSVVNQKVINTPITSESSKYSSI